MKTRTKAWLSRALGCLKWLSLEICFLAGVLTCILALLYIVYVSLILLVTHS